jgi:HEAT repeat protein
MIKKIKIATIVFSMISFSLSYAKDNVEIRGLNFGTKQKKIEIIDKMVKSGNKIYLPELGAVLSTEKSDEVRTKISFALLQLGDSTCIPYYKKTLDDTYWQVRLYGIQGLVKYGEETSVEDFKKGMKDSYWQVRYYSAIGLNKYGDETTIPFIVSKLTDTNQDVKAKLLWALFSLMWKDNSRVAFKKLPDNQIKPLLDSVDNLDSEVRLRALWALEASKDKRAIPYFIKMLEDEKDEIKIRALWAIEKFKSEDANKEIESLLLEESTQVKIESIKTLVRLKSSESLTGISNALIDKDDRVRMYSLWAIENFREPLSYPYIVEKLGDDSPQIREYAEKLIRDINDPVFYELLQTFIDNDTFPHNSRTKAFTILGNIGKGDSVKEFLIEKAKDEDASFRHSAIKALYNTFRYDDDYLKILVYQERYEKNRQVKRQSGFLIGKIIDELSYKIRSTDKREREVSLNKIEILSGSRQLTNLLLKMAYSKYPEVREKMLLISKEVPSRTYGRSLKTLIQESDMNIKKLAAFAIGESKYRDAIPQLKVGTRHFDPEYQLICAWALAKMNVSDAFPFGVKYIQSSNVEYQKLAAEIFVFLSNRRASTYLLRSMIDSELEVKLLSAWALARIGEDKGLETLVRLSEESIEPIRTQANRYLSDTGIPSTLRRRVPLIREKLALEKIGIMEISSKVIYAKTVKEKIVIDGSDKERFWRTSQKEGDFVLIDDEKVPSNIQTKVASGHDKDNLYLLFICDDPNATNLTLNSRDFITVSINPLNSEDEWYQFVVHPLGDIKYNYVWKLYQNNETQKEWISGWQSAITIEKSRWVLEMSIPLKDLQINKSLLYSSWGINFQRDSQQVPLTTWTGRIDNPEQFGIINFRE